MTFLVEIAKFLDRVGFENMRGAAVEFRNQFPQRLGELAGRISRRILSVRNEIVSSTDHRNTYL